MTSGFKFRDRAALGYVQMTAPDCAGLLARFEVDQSKDTLLLFQEDTTAPAASLSMADLPTNTVLEVRELSELGKVVQDIYRLGIYLADASILCIVLGENPKKSIFS